MWTKASAVLSAIMSVGAVTTLPRDVLAKAFHTDILVAHDWTELGFDEMAGIDIEANSADKLFITCGSHDRHAQRVSDMSAVLGSGSVRVASVHHGAGEACFLVYGRDAAMKNISQ